MLCDPETLLNNLKDFFIHHFYIGEVKRMEGRLHTGKAYVVQALFAKR